MVTEFPAPRRSGVQPPNQERGRARRDALLRAAIDLIAEGGPKAVTHRAVASRADVPLASTTYYFSSIQQLTEEALQLHVSERVAEMRDLVTLATEGTESAQEIGARLMEALVARPAGRIVAQFELYLEAARTPSLQPAVRQALAEFEGFAVELLTALGAREPEQAAARFLALFDGFALHRVARPRPTDEAAAAVLDGMRALFFEQIMTPSELDRLTQRLASPKR